MLKITKIHLNNMRNDAHFQIHTEFNDNVTRFGAEDLGIKPQFDIYLPHYHSLDAAFRKINKSALTEQIWNADRDRDKIWQGFIAACKAALKHPDTDVQMAAKRLDILIGTYGRAKLARKSLYEQTSATYNILQELNGAYAADVVKVGVQRWVTELVTLNSLCNNLMKERNDETAAKDDTVYKDARGILDGDYDVITERLDALVVVNGAAPYEAFIRSWNATVSKFIAILRGKKHSLNPDSPDSPDLQDGGTDDGAEEQDT